LRESGKAERREERGTILGKGDRSTLDAASSYLYFSLAMTPFQIAIMQPLPSLPLHQVIKQAFSIEREKPEEALRRRSMGAS
jgi:hypothetical protein